MILYCADKPCTLTMTCTNKQQTKYNVYHSPCRCVTPFLLSHSSSVGLGDSYDGGDDDDIQFQHFFSVQAFHIKFEEMNLDANIGKWAVHVINLSRERRHLDRARFLEFWEKLDR